MRILILHNPGAGSSDLGANDLLRLARAAGHDPIYSPAAKREWKNALDAGTFDLCVVAGGDGTVGKLGRALVGRNVPFTVLPFGTANNIAGALGIRDVNIADLISSWSSADRRPFDVGVATGPWGQRRFLESIGVGLVARAISKIDAGQGDGARVEEEEHPEAQIATAREVFEGVLHDMAPVAISGNMDGMDATGAYLLAEVMNCGSIGPGLALAPEASPHDGLLDLVAIGEPHRDELAELVRDSEPQHARTLGVLQGRRATLHVSDGLVHIDDWEWNAPTGAGRTRIEIAVDAGALTVLVPRSTRL